MNVKFIIRQNYAEITFFGSENIKILSLCMQRLLWTSLHKVTKYVNC